VKYRKKPIVIEAERVGLLILTAATQWGLLPEWFRAAYEKGDLVIMPTGINVHTLEGNMFAQFGDMLIRGVKGELYPCKSDIFEASYELYSP
jgi:hypothetical protein